MKYLGTFILFGILLGSPVFAKDPVCTLNINYTKFAAEVTLEEEKTAGFGDDRLVVAKKYRVEPVGLKNFEYDLFYHRAATDNQDLNWMVGEVGGDKPYEIGIFPRDKYTAPFIKAEVQSIYVRLPGKNGPRPKLFNGDYDIIMDCK